jgi:S1-C subfamily serine protease
MTLAALLIAGIAAAQQDGGEVAWVQVESAPTLSIAQDRARDYAARLDNVAGFRSGSGWFAIALGPYTPQDAARERTALRATGAIPSDSYVVDGAGYGARFWPVGPRGGAPVAPNAETPVVPPAPDPAPVPTVQSGDGPSETLALETLAEARASERALTRPEREGLQEALRWFGHYTGAIDAAFGPATRRAMAGWQAAHGFAPTGVLTTAQRAALREAWRAPFDALGLATVRDERAGIEMLMPAAKVAYARTEPPFVHYDATDDGGMRLLLISQAGGEATLSGLYDVLQTLEIVPREGPRERAPREFRIRGQAPGLSSHAYARLSGGAVKGFVLVWREGDPRVMERVIARMEESLRPLSAVLPDAPVTETAEPQPDLLAGLRIRQPLRVRTGFFVDAEGRVLTSDAAVADCGRVTLGDDLDASVDARDATAGLALLRPAVALAPRAVARFAEDVAPPRAEVAVAGFPWGGVLRLPVLTYGTLAAHTGLDGEAGLARLDLAVRPGDGGGPVLDPQGRVVALMRPPAEQGARRLPDGVSLAVDAGRVVRFLSDSGVTPAEAAAAAVPLDPENLADLAADLALSVTCWE